VASVNSALQRARATVDERLPEQSQQATLRTLGDEELCKVVEDYMDAMQRGDVEAVVGMLAEDAAWFTGDALRDFLAFGPLSGAWRWRHRAGRANGQPAVGSYAWHAGVGAYLPFALDVLTLEGTKIKEITSFITRSTEGQEPDFYLHWPAQPVDLALVASFFERFGMPGRLD